MDPFFYIQCCRAIVGERNVDNFELSESLKEGDILTGKSKLLNDYHYDRYNPLSKIESELFRLRDKNPKIMSLYEIGQTHENRSIITIKVMDAFLLYRI